MEYVPNISSAMTLNCPLSSAALKKVSEEVRRNALRVQRPSSTHYEDKAQT